MRDVKRRFAAFLIILPIGFVFIGGYFTIWSVQHPRAVPITYAQFVKTRPQDGWFTITDARVDNSTRIACLTGYGYAVRGAHETAKAPVQVVYLTYDLPSHVTSATQADGMIRLVKDESHANLGPKTVVFDKYVVALNSNGIPHWQVGVVLLAVGVVLGLIIYPALR